MRAWGRDGGRGGGRSRPTPYSRGRDAAPSDDCTVFVGNLSFDTTWQELKDHFKAVGTVERADIMEKYDGTSKGVGLVRFSSTDEACEAIEAFNETEFAGREIFVRADKGGGGKGGEKGGRGSGGGKGKGGGRGKGGGKGGGKGAGRPKSAADLDRDLDAFMGGGGADGAEEGGDGAQPARGGKGGKGGKGGPPKSADDLDGDLDSYFATKKADKAEE